MFATGPYLTGPAAALQRPVANEHSDKYLRAILLREQVDKGKTSATDFLFHVISRLQEAGTVPMIDMSAYAAHLPQA
jgi:hypothetical protein